MPKDTVGPACNSNSWVNHKIKDRYLMKCCLKKEGRGRHLNLLKKINKAPSPVLFHFKPQQFAMAYIVYMEILSHKITVRCS